MSDLATARLVLHPMTAAEAEGVADGDDLVADLEGRGVAELDGRETGHTLDLDEGDVDRGVGTDQLGLVGGAVVQDERLGDLIEGLASGIRDVLLDHALAERLAGAARAYAQRHLGQDVFVRSVQELYDHICGREIRSSRAS